MKSVTPARTRLGLRGGSGKNISLRSTTRSKPEACDVSYGLLLPPRVGPGFEGETQLEPLDDVGQEALDEVFVVVVEPVQSPPRLTFDRITITRSHATSAVKIQTVVSQGSHTQRGQSSFT